MVDVEQSVGGIEQKDSFGKIFQLDALDVTLKFQLSMIQMLPSHVQLIKSIKESVRQHVQMVDKS